MENPIKPMRFQVPCLDPKSWAAREQTVESTSRNAASASLTGSGAIILAMNELKDDGFQASPKGVRIDVSWWCRELKMLLVAGMPVVEAIETLQVQTTDPAQRGLYEQISALLQQGMSLSSALSEATVRLEVELGDVAQVSACLDLLKQAQPEEDWRYVDVQSTSQGRSATVSLEERGLQATRKTDAHGQ